MTKERYEGPIPDGFIRIKPSDEVGSITIRATCVHGVIQAAGAGALINLDGEHDIEYVNLVTGVMGGKKFSFKFDDDMMDIMKQLQDASFQVILEGTRERPLDFIPDPDEGESVN